MKRVTKAVFPVAGLGTRFLPATKASPKEMLPIVDRPLIQYAVDEAVSAGIKDLIFVTGRAKRAIEDHFDRAFELEIQLEAAGKMRMLKMVRELTPADVNCVFIRQGEALGLGHAVLCARPLVGDEPFAVILADDLIDSRVPVLRQMADLQAKHGGSLVAVQEVPREETASYGIVSTETPQGRLAVMTGIVEKPRPAAAPSTLGVVGRYVLTPAIFDLLGRTRPGAGREIQLTDAIGRLLKTQTVRAYAFEGRRYDCGSKIGYLEATVDYALKHAEVADEFRGYLEKVVAGGKRKR